MHRLFILTLTFAFITGNPALARDKTDVIVLINGDNITGEIKSLQRGILSVGTDSMGEVHIEWEDVVRIESDYEFQFERSDGQRVVATIQDTDEQHKMTLLDVDREVSYAHDKVVRISQIENTFWDRVNGSANFGYSFTKASDVAQLNFGVRTKYRTALREFAFDANVITTSDQDDESTQRTDISFTMSRFRKNRWFSTYLAGLESNDELGLKLRSSLGVGGGRYLIQTNSAELSLIGGIVGTAETLNGDTSARQNLEGLLGASYSKYVFNDPSIDMSLKLTVYPSITDAGRTRAQFDAKLRRELISDLYWDLTFYETFDSDPPSGLAESTTDYGIVTSLGWSF